MKEVLMHACCAPCSLMPLKYLKEDNYNPLLFFYNPNIHNQEEFEKRRDTFKNFVENDFIPAIVEDKYLGFNTWAEKMPSLEFPKRCASCYFPRLEKSAQKAVELNIPAFTTSLLYSRYQQQEIIIEQGHKLAEKYSLNFIDKDFRPYWHEGIKLSKEKNMYRQKYCGCGLPETIKQNTKEKK